MRAVAINTITPLTGTLKIAFFTLIGKMFSEYSICDKLAVVKLLKEKGCSKDEINDFVKKSMITTNSLKRKTVDSGAFTNDDLFQGKKRIAVTWIYSTEQ